MTDFDQLDLFTQMVVQERRAGKPTPVETAAITEAIFLGAPEAAILVASNALHADGHDRSGAWR